MNHIDFKMLRQFSDFTLQIRNFFRERQFLGAHTPTLVSCPGTEPFLDVFATDLLQGRQKKRFYLPTSPEISLKKLICLGSGPVFEIKNVFRNNETGSHHEPEFLMLEWYRPHSQIDSMMRDVKELVQFLSGNSNLQFQTKTIAQLFSEHLGFSLTPRTTKLQLAELAQRYQLTASEKDSIDDLFGLIFVGLIEPKLDQSTPLFVTKYPPFQAAYAKLDSEGWAERFEFYWHGLEIGNAFYEITDPDQQRQRMLEDNEKKKKLGKDSVGIDEEFLNLMKQGMPECSGIAIGVERLFMAIHNLKEIRMLHPLSPLRNFSC